MKEGGVLAKTDIPTKRLLQLRPEDWIKATTGITGKVRYREMKADKNPKVESRLDSLYIVETENKAFILNLEPQGYVDPALPARMLRYRADIYESMMAVGRKMLPMKQVVIYFSPYDETTDKKIIDDEFEDSRIEYSYDVLRVWEMEKDYVMDNKLYGLYSLLPLMKDDRLYNNEAILKEAVEAALEIDDKALGSDILAAMSFLAEVQFSKDIITKYIRREMLMISELWKEWSEEERLEGEKRGRLEGRNHELIENVITLLTAKFGVLPEDMKEGISKLDRNILKLIITEIFGYESLDDVKKYFRARKS